MCAVQDSGTVREDFSFQRPRLRVFVQVAGKRDQVLYFSRVEIRQVIKKLHSTALP
jgi:hypothetical protein